MYNLKQNRKTKSQIRSFVFIYNIFLYRWCALFKFVSFYWVYTVSKWRRLIRVCFIKKKQKWHRNEKKKWGNNWNPKHIWITLKVKSTSYLNQQWAGRINKEKQYFFLLTWLTFHNFCSIYGTNLSLSLSLSVLTTNFLPGSKVGSDMIIEILNINKEMVKIDCGNVLRNAHAKNRIERTPKN